jgi:hypothetical protein
MVLEFSSVLEKLTASSTDWLSGILLVGLDDESLHTAISQLVDGLTCSGAWPFGRFKEKANEYARRGGAMYLEAPGRLTVVSETTTFALRCQAYVSKCRADPLLDGKRRMVVAGGVSRLPWHVQDAMCKVIDECSAQAMYVVPTTRMSGIRAGLRSRLLLVRVSGKAVKEAEGTTRMLLLTAEQALTAASSSKHSKPSAKPSMRALLAEVLDSLDPDAGVERSRAVEALAEADHALAQMEALCGDGIESSAQQENARRKLVLDAALERLRERVFCGTM